MHYFLIHGRLKALSVAELKAVLSLYPKFRYTLNTRADTYITIDTDIPEELMSKLFSRLGGFLKYGILVGEDPDFLAQYSNQPAIKFGVSYYPYNEKEFGSSKVESYAQKIKENLKRLGVNARYTVGRGNTLSTGSILQNQLLEKGFELSVLETSDKNLLIGKTIAIQDIEGFTERDYDKPGYDKEMGMLPPKLARIMLNLATVKENGAVWDPFCGSGVILMEAMLLGYDVIGSDISGEAVASTENNIKWMAQKYNLKDQKFNVFVHDISKEDAKLQKTLRNTQIDAVVFEPYMGPPQRKVLAPNRAMKLVEEVSKLLESVYAKLEYIKAPQLKVVAVIPSYKTFDGWVSPRFNSFLSKKWKVLNSEFKEKDLHWSRSNSIIRRNILVTQLKK
ncbi:MAG: TRM11 family methyltransferase [Candidatus Dojkabacteria bacterium]